jgi:hypothetical protein
MTAAVEDVENDSDRYEVRPAAERSCYLPWCQQCFGPQAESVAFGDYGHHHIGTIGTVCVADAPDGEIQTVTIALDRYDDDTDDDPDGPTTICLTVGGNAYLSPTEARRIARLLLEAAQAQQRFAHLANPNRA